jgi:hypothetical protein
MDMHLIAGGRNPRQGGAKCWQKGTEGGGTQKTVEGTENVLVFLIFLTGTVLTVSVFLTGTVLTVSVFLTTIVLIVFGISY